MAGRIFSELIKECYDSVSRIFGLISFEKERASQLVETLRNSLGLKRAGQLEILPINRGCIGWHGRICPQVTSKHKKNVAFDGVVYNFDDLGQCESSGSLFINLYEQFGFERTCQLVNGDFAISLYDDDQEQLWLARDRVGVKPLYYTVKSDYFAFSSQPGLLLDLPLVSREANRKFAALFAGSHYRYIDNDPTSSPYAEISQLPAGHALSLKGRTISLSPYWKLQKQPDFDKSKEVLAQEYRELLFDAVRLRLKPSEERCFTLSGGMDSSSVLAAAARLSSQEQAAFSAVYRDKTFDESDDIQPMLTGFVRQWHPILIENPDLERTITQMIEVHEEPVATATWLSHFIICKEVASQGFEAVFGGLGGDELNAGEFEYFIPFFADLHRAGLQERLSDEVRYWQRYHNHPLYPKNPETLEKGLRTLVDLNRVGVCLPDHNRLTRYFSTINRDYFDLNKFEPIMDHPFEGYLKNRTYQDLFRETTPCCLRAEDRHASAFGLRNVLPFLDYRLIEFMFRVPTTYKYNKGVTKSLLRQAMQGVLPEKTVTRIKKTGFNAPAHLWFTSRGAELLKDLLHSQAFRERGIYNIAEVMRLLQEHEKIVRDNLPAENHMMFFWQLLNLEIWFRKLNSLGISPRQSP